ncbi:MAG: response regulator [Halanaeroarchaeum sp.]
MGETGSEGDQPRVLIVEDETGLAELYSLWLSEEYEVETAYSGAEALEVLDESFDVVLLDRRMPGISGDEVLEAIRDAGYECQVAMVTGVKPDVAIADAPIEEYLTKPIERDRLENAVDELLLRSDTEAIKQELLSLISKRVALESEHVAEDLEDHETFQSLNDRIERIQSELEIEPSTLSSKHRPAACPNCKLKWDLSVDGIVGFVPIGARVWKCENCGEVVHKSDPSHRRVNRR